MSLPQIAALEFDTSSDAVIPSGTIHKTLAWDFDAGDFKLTDGKTIELTGTDYLEGWIQKVLQTVKDTLIYEGTNYGSEHQTMIGRNFTPDFFRSELERAISEALLQNDAITGVSGFTYSQSGSRMIVSFNVQSIYGSTTGEVAY